MKGGRLSALFHSYLCGRIAAEWLIIMNKKSQKLQTRDFISVGIFSLIYSAVAFIIGGIAQMTPITFPFMPMIVALFTGTVFMLYIAKIPKRGAITILGIISGILLFITGMFWMMSAFFVVLGSFFLVKFMVFSFLIFQFMI